MHKSLAEAFLLRKSVISVCHFGKLGIHARIPASVTNYAVSGLEIFDVIALTGGAYKRTRSATKTGA